MSGSAEPSFCRVAIFSRGMARIPHLASLLGAEDVLVSPGPRDARRVDAVVGWGQKGSAAAARAYARRHSLPYWRAEDGFLRSVDLGASGAPPLSIVLDDLGIYYDARMPSRLEALLAGDERLGNAALLRRSRALIDRIVSEGLSKYNHSPPGAPALEPSSRRRVLVVDQTRGDLAIRFGRSSAATFSEMLAAALREHPDAEIVVKTHPDVVAGAKGGYLEGAAGPRVRVLAADLNPIRLVQAVDHVYVATSQLGFEALLAGVPVTCFGAPFYAGWGLTDDRQALPRRTRRLSLEELFAGAYILYARYVDPETGKPAEIENVVDHLALQRRAFRENRGRLMCFGFQLWKRGYIRRYLRCPGNDVRFARSAAHAERLGYDSSWRAVFWGQRASPAAVELTRRLGIDPWRMEDGFIRSVGLGSDLAPPASLVVDTRGIYYDPTRASDIEEMLEKGSFGPAELCRAAALRATLLATRLSKYNIGSARPLEVPAGRRVVFVPGQVEDDASLALGCRSIRNNTELLAAVRERCPDAYILFRPHPDVVSGNRRGALPAGAAARLCDHVETSATLADCLDVAAEVHTLTSTVGFEALLRGLRVVVYGQPFYSGWGLTDDLHPHPRRTRSLSVDELVAATLLRYPRYRSARSGAFSTPEAVVAELAASRDADPAEGSPAISWGRRQLRKAVRAGRGALDAL